MPTRITNIPELEAYLTAKSIPYTSATLLTGGTANFVFRLTLPPTTPNGSSPSKPQTLIIKHSEPFIASNPSIPFPTARMDFEAHALQKIDAIMAAASTLPTTPPTVQPVELLAYDEENKTMQIADGGHRNLKDAYTDPDLDIVACGRHIGAWLAALHASTRGTDIGDNKVAKHIYRTSYRGLGGALSKLGNDGTAELGEAVDGEFGALLNTDDEVVCHGDFWPGNVLVGDAVHKAGVDLQLTIVDWEMVRRGTGATDVGQFAAEAFLLDRFRGNRGLRITFLTTYAEAAKEGLGEWKGKGKEFVTRTAVHWGTHVAFWPTRVAWGTEEETKELVRIGLGVIVAAKEGRWEGLGGSELFGGVEEVWRGIWEG